MKLPGLGLLMRGLQKALGSRQARRYRALNGVGQAADF
jgi:hypothetical protein